MARRRIKPEEERGLIGWMTANRVTPNLIMIALIVGGLLAFHYRMQKEVFPSFDLDTVQIEVRYPGAGPEEIEKSIVQSIESDIAGIDGIKEVRGTAAEGRGSVTVELRDGAPRQEVLQDIQQAVDSIETFPTEARRPTVALSRRQREVLDLQIYGEVSPLALRNAAEEVRDALLRIDGIDLVELEDSPEFEVIIEIPSRTLRSYGISLLDVESAIERHSQEVPSGKVETPSGEILLRLRQRSDWATEYAEIPIVNLPDGTLVTLGEMATLRESFEEVDKFAIFNGQRNITLEIFRVGDQTPIEVSEATRAAMVEIEASLPEGVKWYIPSDRSDLFKDRRDLLMKNLGMGLLLVLIVLGVFLEIRLAFWVMMGIPISFLGALLILPEVGVSFNIISMFAFIIAVGVVVDDAIVVGENVYDYREKGMSYPKAAVYGTRDVSVPVIFAIVTNLIAFAPLFFLEGRMGKIWLPIPFVVMSVFVVSLVESLIILPAHLAHGSKKPLPGILGVLSGAQQAFSRWFTRRIQNVYGPLIEFCMRFRIPTVTFMVGILIFSVGYFQSGRLRWQPFPSPESDSANVTAVVPQGSSREHLIAVNDQLLAGADEVISANGGEELAYATRSRFDGTEIQVSVYLTDPETRPISTSEFVEKWREAAGEVHDVETLRYESDRGGPGGGPAIDLQLSHKEVATLERAASDLASFLEARSDTKDVDSGVSAGKRQLDYRLKPEFENLGLDAASVAAQVRAAYLGTTSIRQQRGAHEVTVRVRLPIDERSSFADLDTLMLRTRSGEEIPFGEVAEISQTRAFKSIERIDGHRITAVSCGVTNPAESQLLMNLIREEVMPQLQRDYPGLAWKPRGRRADVNDSLIVLWKGLAAALAVIYFVLAIPFRSYIQPMIVMIAIPFGVVGAVVGHMLMGYTASLISVLGVIALSGVVVNDSLVLVTYANELREKEGLTALEAVKRAGIRRFRPIILTTATTFMGLAPMIFETSRQAQFIIPMAISLGFGIVFATAITLIVVPAVYVLVEDLKNAFAWTLHQLRRVGVAVSKL